MTIKELDDLGVTAQRIFTYKVMFDGGTAPNPFGGVCTLAICKPAIRRVAIPNDLIVGLTPGNEGRIVYCMQVTDKIPWKEYIELCTNKALRDTHNDYSGLAQKIPKSEKDQGDCIWRNADVHEAVRPTYSEHEGEQDFNHDVASGKSVLLSTKYWYFGKGDKFDIYLSKGLKQMIPGRGHRSKGNDFLQNEFVSFFNDKLKAHSIGEWGVHGTPEHAPETSDKSTCSRCRARQDADDQIGEQ